MLITEDYPFGEVFFLLTRFNPEFGIHMEYCMAFGLLTALVAGVGGLNMLKALSLHLEN